MRSMILIIVPLFAAGGLLTGILLGRLYLHRKKEDSQNTEKEPWEL